MPDSLIDWQGKIWSTHSRTLVAELGRLLQGEADPVSASVWKLGFVLLRRVKERGVLMAFQPAIVGTRALAGAFYQLGLLQPERVVLCYAPVPDDRSHVIVGDWTQAFGRVGQIVERYQQAGRPGLRARPRQLSQIRCVSGGKMFALFGAWNHMSAMGWSPDFYRKLIDDGLLDDAVVVRRPAGSERLVIEHWGWNRRLLGAQWAGSAVGQDVRDQPFPYLVPWLVGSYRRATADMRAQLHSVDVAVVAPGNELRRRSYDRLLLPFQGGSGDGFAVTVSVDATQEAGT